MTKPQPRVDHRRRWIVFVVVLLLAAIVLLSTGQPSSEKSSDTQGASSATNDPSSAKSMFIDDHQFHWIANPFTGHSGDPYHNYSVAFLALHANEVPENTSLAVQGVMAVMRQGIVIVRDADNPNALAACVMKEGEFEWMTTFKIGEPVAVLGEYAGPSPYTIAGVAKIPMLTQCSGYPVDEHIITPASRPARKRKQP